MEEYLIISSTLLWLVLIFNLTLTLVLIRRATKKPLKQEIGLNKGEKAPDFVAETLNGEKVTLSNYLGKRTAFIFFTTTCTPCQEYVPKLNELVSNKLDSKAEFVLVSLSEVENT